MRDKQVHHETLRPSETTDSVVVGSMASRIGVFAFLLAVLLPLATGLDCYAGSFVETSNEMSFEESSSITCNSTVKYCISEYVNNGQDTVYGTNCDITGYCKEAGCTRDLGNSARYCCCTDDLCVHDDASKPIEYPLDGILMSSATAAYQVEGAVDVDGRGPSIWDVWTKRPNVIHNNDTGEIACDSYHNWKEDIALLKAMNVNQYRFSVSWSRIFTDGTIDTANQKGVDYYNNIINELIKEGIEPVISIFHWDLPQGYMDKGGWLNQDTVTAFGVYSKYVFEKFGDRVKRWVTINEPLSVQNFEYCGDGLEHADGNFIPHCGWTMYLAAANLLRAHLAAVKEYNKLDEKYANGTLGVALSGSHFFPNDPNKQSDIDAAERAFQWSWGLYAHPIYSADGDWSDIVKERIANLSIEEGRIQSRLPVFTKEEIEGLRGSAQFIGVNYYSAVDTVSILDVLGEHRWDFGQGDYDSGATSFSKNTWRQMNATNPWISYVPQGLRALLVKLKTDYNNIPVLITENGVMDGIGESFNDVSRIHYLRGHLMAISQAKFVDGVDVIGYTHWSLMDNFEWKDGYSVKFGLHYVDYTSPNRTRTPKSSAKFFGDVNKAKKVTGFSIDSRY
uniref:Beta-glucosidase n=1 Tax=Panagrellus redivivus TaxID=6233 RepID=A0A7E4WB63_PANRE